MACEHRTRQSHAELGAELATGFGSELAQTIPVEAGATYFVSLTVAGRTAGTLEAEFCGQQVLGERMPDYYDWIANGEHHTTVHSESTGPAELTLKPSADWNGKVAAVSVKPVVSSALPCVSFVDERGDNIAEVRGSHGTGCFYVGLGSGAADVSAEDCIGIGDGALKSLTTGRHNIAIGTGALEDATSGSDAVAVGHLALNSLTVGLDNVAVGRGCLRLLETGSRNYAFGYACLENGTSHNMCCAFGYRALTVNKADANSAFGSSALAANQSGTRNNAYGREALKSNVTGSYNVAVGNNSLQSQSAGNRNTAIGVYAGYGSTGSGCVFVGHEAGRIEKRDNRLTISNKDTDRPLIGGDFKDEVVEINGDLCVESGKTLQLGTGWRIGVVDDSVVIQKLIDGTWTTQQCVS